VRHALSVYIVLAILWGFAIRSLAKWFGICGSKPCRIAGRKGRCVYGSLASIIPFPSGNPSNSPRLGCHLSEDAFSRMVAWALPLCP
jgi:hypothetical protein